MPTDSRVEAVTSNAYAIPTDCPESDGTLEWDSTTVVVAVLAAGETAGLGYTYAAPEAAEVIRSLLGPIVLGGDALSPPAHWARMQSAVRNVGRQGLCAMAISAVDIALWDLRAKLLGLSLVDSLGRFRNAIPAYGSGGFTSYSDARLREQLETWLDQRFDQVKIKVGRNPEEDPHRLDLTREVIGDHAALMVDANGAFSRHEARGWAERYASWGVSYLEEPVSSEDIRGLCEIRDRAPRGMAIAAGEYAWDLPEIERLAECVDIVQADVTRCGGITNLLRADGVCRAKQVPFSAHCAPQVSAHLCCAMETAVHVEYFHDHARVESLLFDGTLPPREGRLEPDLSRPGLGIELKLSDAEQFRV